MHTVKKGETIFSISKLYGVSQQAILDLNKISNAIQEGQVIGIPENVVSPIKLFNIQTEALKCVLDRFKGTHEYTLGTMTVKVAERWDRWKTIFVCKTLELAWNDNQNKISCIPEGTYPLVFEYSESFKQNLWELKQVPDRSEVKIHALTDVTQLEGCIGVGREHKEFRPGVMGITYSGDTLKEFHSALNGQKYLTLEINVS